MVCLTLNTSFVDLSLAIIRIRDAIMTWIVGILVMPCITSYTRCRGTQLIDVIDRTAVRRDLKTSFSVGGKIISSIAFSTNIIHFIMIAFVAILDQSNAINDRGRVLIRIKPGETTLAFMPGIGAIIFQTIIDFETAIIFIDIDIIMILA